MNGRAIGGVAFLAAQLLWTLWCLAGDARHFAWSPHTVQIRYALEVTVDGRALTEAEVRRRYGLINYPWEVHAIDHVAAIVEQHARTYGRGESADVVLRYRVNGGEARERRWSFR